MKDRKYYEAPIYIIELIKKLNKLVEKEENILQQLNDFIEFKGYPKDIDFSQLKHNVDGVIPGQIRGEIFD